MTQVCADLAGPRRLHADLSEVCRGMGAIVDATAARRTDPERWQRLDLSKRSSITLTRSLNNSSTTSQVMATSALSRNTSSSERRSHALEANGRPDVSVGEFHTLSQPRSEPSLIDIRGGH